MQSLARGVNLSIWFAYRGQPGIDPARWYPDAEDWRRIRALGFTHVRVQFDPLYFRDASRPGGLHREHLAELRRELAPAWKQGLLVVLAADPEPAEKSRLLRDDAGIAHRHDDVEVWTSVPGAWCSKRSTSLPTWMRRATAR